MPYRLEQSGSGFYVVGPSGRHSKRPLPRKRAVAQLRALSAQEQKQAAPHWGVARKSSAYSYAFKADGTPGELIAPGVRRIRGNLCNVHGRYGPCDKAATGDRRPSAPGFGPGKPKKGAKPKKTEAERQAEQEAKRQAKLAEQRATRDRLLTEAGIDANTQGALIDARDGNTLTPANGKKLAEMGLAEQNADGTYRLTPKAMTAVDAALRGDAGRLSTTLASARDQVADRSARDAKRAAADQEREQKRQEREAARQKKGGGGRAAPAKPEPAANPAAPTAEARATARTAEEQRQRQANRATVRAAMAESDQGLSPSGFDQLTRFADGAPLDAGAADQFAQMGLVAGTPPRLTPSARLAIQAIDRGNIRGAIDAINQAGDEQASATTRAAERAAQDADRAQRRARADARRAAIDARVARREATERERQINRAPVVQKTFAVFKDARGRLRWITRTTTAYKDRDREILSMLGLTRAVARMKASGLYGPLRWWHVGRPDPDGDPRRPWGPGVDLGMCDYADLIGRTLVESGTFFDEQIGMAIAAKAAAYEVSPGFAYEPVWREPDGTFRDLLIFERSLVPVAYARASNYFTGMVTTKESSPMNEQDIRAKLAALKAETGADQATIDRLYGELEQSEKTANRAGIVFKAAGLQTYDIGGEPYVIVSGALVALKSLAAKADMPAAEMEDAGATELADGAAEAASAGDDRFVGDLTIDELREVFREVVREASGALTEMEAKMASMGFERRQKEQAAAQAAQAAAARPTQAAAADPVAAQLASYLEGIQTQLKASREQQAKLEQQIAALTDDSAAAQQATGAPFIPSQHAQSADPATVLAIKSLQAAQNGSPSALDDVRKQLFGV